MTIWAYSTAGVHVPALHEAAAQQVSINNAGHEYFVATLGSHTPE